MHIKNICIELFLNKIKYRLTKFRLIQKNPKVIVTTVLRNKWNKRDYHIGILVCKELESGTEQVSFTEPASYISRIKKPQYCKTLILKIGISELDCNFVVCCSAERCHREIEVKQRLTSCAITYCTIFSICSIIVIK